VKHKIQRGILGGEEASRRARAASRAERKPSVLSVALLRSLLLVISLFFFFIFLYFLSATTPFASPSRGRFSVADPSTSSSSSVSLAAKPFDSDPEADSQHLEHHSSVSSDQTPQHSRHRHKLHHQLRHQLLKERLEVLGHHEDLQPPKDTQPADQDQDQDPDTLSADQEDPDAHHTQPVDQHQEDTRTAAQKTHSTHHDTHTMEMQMWFYWSTRVTVLFHWWTTNTLFEYLLTLLALCLLGISYELLSTYKAAYELSLISASASSASSTSSASSSASSSSSSSSFRGRRSKPPEPLEDECEDDLDDEHSVDSRPLLPVYRAKPQHPVAPENAGDSDARSLSLDEAHYDQLGQHHHPANPRHDTTQPLFTTASSSSSQPLVQPTGVVTMLKHPFTALCALGRSRSAELTHLTKASLHVLQLVIGYALMLAVMTYNAGVALAVFFGAFLGYFLFARTRSASPTSPTGCHST